MNHPHTPAVLPQTEQLDEHLNELEDAMRDAQQFRTLEEKVQDLKDQGRLRTGDATDDPADSDQE